MRAKLGESSYIIGLIISFLLGQRGSKCCDVPMCYGWKMFEFSEHCLVIDFVMFVGLDFSLGLPNSMKVSQTAACLANEFWQACAVWFSQDFDRFCVSNSFSEAVDLLKCLQFLNVVLLPVIVVRYCPVYSYAYHVFQFAFMFCFFIFWLQSLECMRGICIISPPLNE